MTDFDAKLRPHLEPLLEPGETLEGVRACSQQKGLFSGGAVALGVTPTRLLVQPLSRRGEPEGEAQVVWTADIAEAKAEGAGGGWAEIGAAILDETAVRLILNLQDGEKLRLMMMRGDGPIGIGSLGGGESQRQGMQALAAWVSRAGQAD